MSFRTYNIHDMLEQGGRDSVSAFLKQFTCPVNHEIETFVTDRAVEFALKKISVTYFVLNSSNEISGFFTLTHKPSFILIGALGSKTLERKLERFSSGMRIDDRFLSSAFLIAQFGKNMTPLKGEMISGNELMDCAFEVLEDVQRKIGGGVVFLECENKQKLLDFYQNEHNHFIRFGTRLDKTSQIEYIQLLRVF